MRGHARGLGLQPEDLKSRDIHIHVPAGGVPKDGPSAGIVIVTALVSALTGKTVRPDVAMTDEITLSGDVLPLGGIREKVLAARRSGVRDVVLPEMNAVNATEDLPEPARADMTFHSWAGIEAAKVVVARGSSGRYLMAVLPAPRLVDTEAMADVAGETRVWLVDEGEVAQLFPDCETGAMPPFGNLYGVPVYVDDTLARADEIVFPAGSHRETLRMRYRDYKSLVHPAVGHLSL